MLEKYNINILENIKMVEVFTILWMISDQGILMGDTKYMNKQPNYCFEFFLIFINFLKTIIYDLQE